MKQVTLFTDGSCLGNPGPGGWACLLRCGSAEEEISGTEAHTTNNRMELQAVIAGLGSERATVFAIRQRAMTQHLRHWIARGWLNSRGTPVSNQDLWNALLRESSRHQVTWSWVRGHGASAEQNRCDKLAQAAARSLMVAF